ncbi:L,D-transpeptidase [Ensifer sp.]|jgi:lipoprotein-anchoring transpeptidase ErfK/SrfK|uniref:L,D-transpeptidase family protein n=1 Tax=Ensifer sp. TaxID=1872086 RepID=UPI002E0D1A1F|nr:L,D-transpeptidase [Ensifer sp.]
MSNWMRRNGVASASLLLFLSQAQAQAIKPDDINNAVIVPAAADRSTMPAEAPDRDAARHPDPAIVRLQVLLDRAGASPGVIDGFDGENVGKAISAFEAMQDLPVDGRLDQGVADRLSDQRPAIEPYVISKGDVEDLVSSIPKDFAEQAKMGQLGYTSITEKLAERFHMDADLLSELNSQARFEPGETIFVANPGSPKQGLVKRIEAHKRTRQLLAFADDDTLVAAYPATIGSEETPSPSGTQKVKGAARMPPYTYNPKINFRQGGNKKIMTLPGGPNNPVGTVWIDLTKPTYGIHGTPEPSLIDKSGSHGCVRLTNWDAEELAGMVKPGVVVKFLD